MGFIRKNFPPLAEEFKWGDVSAKFNLVECPREIKTTLIGNVNMIPYTKQGYVIVQVENGDWELPGGTLEKGESYQQTLQREIREELGGEIISFEVLGFFSCYSSAKNVYKPHLPHPNFIRLVGGCEVRLVQKPQNPPGAEKVTRVETVGIN